MAKSSHPKRRVRVAAIASGVVVMIGCAVVALSAGWWFYGQWPDAQPDGLISFLALIPVTAMLILIAGSIWTRGLHASFAEGVAALFCIELITCGIVVFYTGFDWSYLLFAGLRFVVAANVIFAPWWLLGLWLGRRREEATRARSTGV